jgi:lysophospholipase L1-like esterase
MKQTVFVLLVLSVSCGADAARGKPVAFSPDERPDAGVMQGRGGHTDRQANGPSLPPETTAPSARNASQDGASTPDAGQRLHVETAMEDPGGTALSLFYQALERARMGSGQARIVFYGASHVASDLFTNGIRQKLQLEFGEGGAGFVLPGKPWRWYGHAGVKMERSKGWKALRVRAYAPKGGLYGFAGVALESRADRRALGAVSTRPNGELSGQASRFELFYLKQPGGGRMRVFIDGERIGSISTAAARPEAGYELFEVSDGHHRFEVRAIGNGPVRLFGVAIERDSPGVILDTLGIPGARARYHLHWNDALYREHLARRRPDLVALAYGTNESGDDDVPLEFYEKTLREVMDRIKETVPDASCLLIGPSDWPRKLEQREDEEQDEGQNAERRTAPDAGEKSEPGDAPDAGLEAGHDAATDAAQGGWPDYEWCAERGYGPRPLTAEIIAVQRRVARDYSCGFFDLVAFMGGEMSMVRWAAASPPLGSKDHVHFTLAGYRLLGDALHRALMEGYRHDD